MVEDKELSAQRSAWFVQDRFGLFIHWGLYSAIARYGRGGLAEWSKSTDKISEEKYQDYFDAFDPDLYDPRAWARTAKQAGMRYAVITTKHHDGFCLWDSALTDYKASNTQAGRDLLREWVDAFRAEGLKIGFYHSLIDWHHSEFTIDGFHPRREDLEFREREKGRDMHKYAEYLHGQVRELLTGYGQIDIMWLDFSYTFMDWDWAKGKGKDDWQSEKLVAMIRELQPDILLNNRLEVEGDFQTPEQYQPRTWISEQGKRVTWEVCQTLNGSWGYDRDNQNWKSPDLLVRMLIDTVSKGGNLILNVGPTARGEFDPQAVATLQALGEWTHVHGRAVYGATQSTYSAPEDCRFTRRGKRLYLHIFAWPMQHLHLDGLAGRVTYAHLLNDGSEIRFQEGIPDEGGHVSGKDGMRPDTLTLELPIQRPDVLVPVIELFLKDEE
ncbi:alpha-L-fucosidase [Dictyobacter arantiisoli]|uniref:alpha-L-fucosidase n=1 Tax=Dictyobacter arantiisoli TaxID=2014874 RepID=A0A5A5TE36_9CHLR|nr:alpha-L-fucosidase [Dictyobacter arantiisoli]GCF09810.1 alpha-L-fucosidase [Dictyobacter arantiisoli]